MTDLPSISLVTPNYNEEGTISKTIKSVISQDYPYLEYIVIDDGSNDRSVEKIKSFDKHLAYWETHPNKGQYYSINRGFRESTGEIMGWLNSDDISLPWTLSTVGKIFAKFPDIDWIMGLPTTMSDGAILRTRQCVAMPTNLIRAGCYSMPPFGVIQQESTFWRRSLWETCGPLTERWTRAADFALWLDFASGAELVTCEAILGGFTRTGRNRSVLHANAYLQEVESIIDELPDDLKNLRRRISNRLTFFEHLCRWTKVDMTKAPLPLGLSNHSGRTLRFDFTKQEFFLRTQPLTFSLY